MEIPIQVAVRVCPAEHVVNRCPPQFQLNAEDASNGNTSLITNEIVSESKTNSCPNLEKKEENNQSPGCVKAIPLADLSDFGEGNNVGRLENGVTGGVIQIGEHSFNVTHALSERVNQSQVYHQTVSHLMSLFMEGFDASVVSYGQSGTGKTYTLYGRFVDESEKNSSNFRKNKMNNDEIDNNNGYNGESEGVNRKYKNFLENVEEGIVQRCIREIFQQISQHTERNYIINIGWVDICGDEITDILGVGNVACTKLADVFHWLHIGLNFLATNLNRGYDNSSGIMRISHTLFTLTLEQQWVSKEGLIQHRLSTASFSDLCGKRFFCLNNKPETINIPFDLEILEQVVCTLAEPSLMYQIGIGNGNIPYLKTMLTRLLKDSFGGRAQTLMILCVSPFEKDVYETIRNLQFALKVQTVRNYVIMNTFSDDNTPISPTVINESIATALVSTASSQPIQVQDNFGLQFAASQWCKLVTNAEGLFAKYDKRNLNIIYNNDF